MAALQLPALLLGAAVLVASFWQAKIEKRAEVPLYSGPRFSVKLARYERRPLLAGATQTAIVSCQSDSTHNAPSAPEIDPGWVELGRLPVARDETDASLEETARARFRAIDDRVLVWTGVALSVSYYGCRSFERFDPTLLPAELVDPAPRGKDCAPQGTVDCRYVDFQGERWPDYSEIQATPDGRVSFVLRSKALRDPQPLHVESTDYGRSWSAGGRPLPPPARVRD